MEEIKMSELTKISDGIYTRENDEIINKLFVINGYVMKKYEYPKIKTRFSSPLLNDYNLHLCGGWFFPGVKSIESLQRVIDGMKTMGFYDTFDDKKFECWKKIVKDSGLPYMVFSKEENNGLNGIGISIKGTFGENFNLQDLMHDYKLYFNACEAFRFEPNNSVRNKLIKFIKNLKDVEISSYLSFDYSNETKTDEDDILTGLILGYPVETTVACVFN